MEKVYVLMSIYKQQDKNDPMNWATSVFETEELANQCKRDLLQYREDIADVVIFPSEVQDKLPEIPSGLVRSWKERVQSENATQQSVHLTAFGDQQSAPNPLQASMFVEVSPAINGGR